MASLPPSQPVSGGRQPPPAPNITHNNNSNEGGEGNRKRKADEASLDEEEAPVSVCNVSMLPTVVLAIAVSFLPSKDRISVSATCRGLRKAVEDFSEEILNELEKRADKTWKERISNQDSIKTELSKPLSKLPFRYLLSKAMKTHLYRLDNFCFPCLTPDGHGLVGRLVTSTELHKIDLNTKEKERSIISEEYTVSKVEDMSMVDNRVVWVARTPHGDSDYQALVVSNLVDGALLRFVPLRSGRISLLGANRTKVFFSSPSNPHAISCLNPDSDVPQDIATMTENVRSEHVGVFDDFLVVIGARVEEPYQKGMHVFDTNHSRWIHFVPGRFTAIIKPSVSGERAIVVTDTNENFHVFDLADDGKLSERGVSFKCSGESIEIAPFLYKSIVYVSTSFRRMHLVKAYNILNGEYIRSFSFPLAIHCDAVVTNGKEIFFAINSSRESSPPGRHVYAFPLWRTGEDT